MREYILSISAAIILTEIILMLMPEGGIKKFARTALGILLMILILSPLENCGSILPEQPDAAYEKSDITYSGIIMDVYNEAMSNNNK